jgi:hypothetical protein
MAWPEGSYCRTNASVPPELEAPGKAPSVWPATYTPEVSAATAKAAVATEEPNWRAHRKRPEESYLTKKASPLGKRLDLVSPANVPTVSPATYTPEGSVATA